MMALNISKNTACSSNVSGLLVKSALSFGYLTLGFSGSGSFVYTTAIETGNDAAEYSPIIKSDSSELF